VRIPFPGSGTGVELVAGGRRDSVGSGTSMNSQKSAKGRSGNRGLGFSLIPSDRDAEIDEWNGYVSLFYYPEFELKSVLSCIEFALKPFLYISPFFILLCVVLNSQNRQHHFESRSLGCPSWVVSWRLFRVCHVVRRRTERPI
jgi:hypothetical protein